MKIWVDDIRCPPKDYIWAKSVNEAIGMIMSIEWTERYYDSTVGKWIYPIEVIDCDHDAGDYADDGGDYINLLNWLEATNRSYPIHLHTMNPVGRENMRMIIEKNGWREV